MMRAIGLMSGTSMDGIDVALIETDGDRRVDRLGFSSFAYDDGFRDMLRQALVDAAQIWERTERPGRLADVEGELTARHAQAVGEFLNAVEIEPADIGIIAFHGQTVLHRADQRLTVQIGDGAALAEATGIDVVYDLRAADVAAGGQGAPLAPAYHRAMAASLGGGVSSVAILNIGGVANVTFVSANGELTAFDTGPGNALIDDWVFARTGRALDVDGRLALAGKVDPDALCELMASDYFLAKPPKSLDRNEFAATNLNALSVEDGAATLAAFTVEAIVRATEHALEPPGRWLVCGGGRRNAAIMDGLRNRLGSEVIAAEDAGINGDAVEAEAWAYLGVRSLSGAPISFPGTTGVPVELTGGVLAKA